MKCPYCGYTHSSGAAIAVGRFSPEPTKYRAKHGSSIRDTREEAEKDECEWQRNAASYGVAE